MDYRDAPSYGSQAGGVAFPGYLPVCETPKPRRVGAARDRRLTVSAPILAGVTRAVDIGVLLGGIGLAALIHRLPADLGLHHDTLAAAIGAVLAWVCLSRGTGRLRSSLTQLKLGLIALATGFATMHALLLFLQVSPGEQTAWPFAWLLAAGSLLAVWRAALCLLLQRWTRAGSFARSIAVVGANDLGYDFFRRAAAAARTEYCIVGLYDEPPERAGVAVAGPLAATNGSIADLIARCRREPIDAIVIVLPHTQAARAADISRKLQVTVCDVYLAPDIAGLGGAMERIAGSPVVLMQQRPLKDWDALRKRGFDVILAGTLLVLIAPLLLLIALIIRCDSPGPVLFRQPRLGFNNGLFRVYKFRTMHHHMTDLHASQQTRRNDDRITRAGRWLRRFSLDELPQLLNVLKGEMSLVGPRPHALNTKAGEHRFIDAVDNYALRHRVLPGITGWAQVNGWRGETKTLEQIEQRVACDLHYIDNWSLGLDLKILLLTVLRGMSGPAAY